MKKLFDFVDGAFYINLDHRKDKNDIFIKHLQELNIYEFVEKQRGFTPDELGYKLKETGKYPDEGYSKACAYAQIEIIKKAKERGLSNVLIFEDDAEFYLNDNYDPLEIVANAIEAVKKISNWEFFYLGTNPGARDKTFDMVAPNLVKPLEAIANHAMLINSTVFDKILNDSLDKNFNYIDIYFSNTFREKYLAYPLCVMQRCGIENDIGEHTYTGLCSDFWVEMYNKKINIKY